MYLNVSSLVESVCSVSMCPGVYSFQYCCASITMCHDICDNVNNLEIGSFVFCTILKINSAEKLKL